MKHNVYSLSSPFSSPPFPLSSLLFSFPFLFLFFFPFSFSLSFSLSLSSSFPFLSSFPSFFFPFPLPDFCSPSRFLVSGGAVCPPAPPPPPLATPLSATMTFLGGRVGATKIQRGYRVVTNLV